MVMRADVLAAAIDHARAQDAQAPLIYLSPRGEPLTQAHLNATIGGPAIPGTWTYEPPLGTVLNAGYDQMLSVTFTPNDTDQYASATATTSSCRPSADRAASLLR